MTASTTSAVIPSRPQFKFLAILQGRVDLNDGDDDNGPVMTQDQLVDNLNQSLGDIVSNSGITGDSPGQVDVYESQVQVLLTAGETCDESILDHVARLEAELAAAKEWRTKALDLVLRNDHVESVLISLVKSWGEGETLDVLMRNAEQVLQPETAHGNAAPDLITLGADDELHCIGHQLSLGSLRTGVTQEQTPDTKVAPWQAKSDDGRQIEVCFQEAYALGEISTCNTGEENIAVTLGKIACDEILFTGSELVLTRAGVAPIHIPMVGGFFRFGGVVFLDLFASIKGAKEQV